MKITKQQIRAITKDNFATNQISRALLICARSKPEIYTEFLQMGALIMFRRRVLHNEMTPNDREILKLTEWAIDEYGLPKVDDGTSENVGCAENVDGPEQGVSAGPAGQAASGQVH